MRGTIECVAASDSELTIVPSTGQAQRIIRARWFQCDVQSMRMFVLAARCTRQFGVCYCVLSRRSVPMMCFMLSNQIESLDNDVTVDTVVIGGVTIPASEVCEDTFRNLSL
mmetsp:Transcript_9005/g.37141  ORF Transcript_9005/g.37141 Transcript_9005/m.37141 type:complete len:111 (-) Transcript_9005:421-753(-)